MEKNTVNNGEKNSIEKRLSELTILCSTDENCESFDENVSQLNIELSTKFGKNNYPCVQQQTSSIDSENEAFMQQYVNDDYLSKLGIRISSSIPNQEVVDASFEPTQFFSDFEHLEEGILIQERILVNSMVCSTNNRKPQVALNASIQQDRHDEATLTSTVLSKYDKDSISGAMTPVQFWRGYGRNIYFQPMTCKTLSLMKINLNGRKAHCFRFPRKATQEGISKFGQVSCLLETSAMRNQLEDHGSLSFTCSKDRMDPGKITRVGNFVLSKEQKQKVCKGFTSRNLINVPDREDTDIVAVQPQNVPAFPKPVIRNKMFSVNSFDKDKNKTDDKRNYSQRAENQCTPRNERSTKAVSKNTFVPLKNVNMVNIMPFRTLIPGKQLRNTRMHCEVERPLYTTPVENEGISCEWKEKPDKNVVTEYADQILKSRNSEFQLREADPTEDQYAYNSLFTYFNEGAKPGEGSKTSCRANRLSSSLLSSKAGQQHNDKNTNKEFPIANENKTRNKKQFAFSNANNAGVQVKGKAQSHVNNEDRQNFRGSRLISLDVKKYSVAEISATMEVDCRSDHSIAVSSNSPFISSEPFETTSARLLHRYSLASADNCRLPIIGRKIP